MGCAPTEAAMKEIGNCRSSGGWPLGQQPGVRIPTNPSGDENGRC